MSAAVDYGKLLELERPEVVHGDEQYRHYLDRLSEMLIQDNLSPAEEKLVELLTLVIKHYENDRFERTDKSHGVEIVKYLMEHHALKQKDLVPVVFETESVASSTLRGERDLTLKHIKRLAERFNLSADAFID
jgi:HTH-type transcriptional regulator/antitoxin HigA